MSSVQMSFMEQMVQKELRVVDEGKKAQVPMTVSTPKLSTINKFSVLFWKSNFEREVTQKEKLFFESQNRGLTEYRRGFSDKVVKVIREHDFDSCLHDCSGNCTATN